MREASAPTGAPPVVLLHGLTANADLNWFAAIPELRQRFRVVAPDLRGHGDGIQPKRFRLVDVADDVAALIDQLELGPSIVVGYSMGGAVAQLLWRRRPDTVAGLVLCASAADYRPASTAGRWVEQPVHRALGWAGRLLPPRPRRHLVDLARRQTLGRVQPASARAEPIQQWGARQLLRSDPLQVAAASVAVHRYHSEQWVGGVDVPVAMVVTTEDTVVPTSRQLELAALLRAEVHEAEAGHGAFIEAPNAFVPQLAAACASVAAERGRTAGRGGPQPGRRTT